MVLIKRTQEEGIIHRVLRILVQLVLRKLFLTQVCYWLGFFSNFSLGSENSSNSQPDMATLMQEALRSGKRAETRKRRTSSTQNSPENSGKYQLFL